MERIKISNYASRPPHPRIASLRSENKQLIKKNSFVNNSKNSRATKERGEFSLQIITKKDFTKALTSKL